MQGRLSRLEIRVDADGNLVLTPSEFLDSESPRRGVPDREAGERPDPGLGLRAERRSTLARAGSGFD